MRFLYNNTVYFTKVSFGFLVYYKSDSNISHPVEIGVGEFNDAYDNYLKSLQNEIN